ncbi:N-alpha-acetyltransferase 80 [Oratosquilla oratoria]|uniref:N-alpha-acetyltransferase 80 n=1 Tax=Oratosquilla oratoria TaxID=337810 RepID=UPI003F7582E7
MSENMPNDLELSLLHRKPDFLEPCMNMLNDYWPKSRTLRMRSLTVSCDNLPTSLILLQKNGDKEELIGHARINTLPRHPEGVWVESVMIRDDLRGKGYGRLLMMKTEEYARAHGFTESYLSTYDQQGFYGKLGYEFCPPVCLYGGAVHKNFLPKDFHYSPQSYLTPTKKSNDDEKKDKTKVNGLCKLANEFTKSLVIPQTEELKKSSAKAYVPLCKNDIQRVTNKSASKMFMKKQL